MLKHKSKTISRAILSSHFTKLENKIKKITKIANERFRIDLQSQINQLNINLQNTIKINEKTRENIWKTVMEDVRKCYVKY